MTRRDVQLQAFVGRACIVVADGQPLVWCAPFFGRRLPESVAGIDVVEALCERAAVSGVGVYILGSTAPLIEKALVALRSRHQTCGSMAPMATFPGRQSTPGPT